MFCIYLNFIYFKYESHVCSIKKLINIEIAKSIIAIIFFHYLLYFIIIYNSYRIYNFMQLLMKVGAKNHAD